MSGDFSTVGVSADEARVTEERSTERRAEVLHVSYTDTSGSEDKTLFKDILTNEQMRQ